MHASKHYGTSYARTDVEAASRAGTAGAGVRRAAVDYADASSSRSMASARTWMASWPNRRRSRSL